MRWILCRQRLEFQKPTLRFERTLDEEKKNFFFRGKPIFQMMAVNFNPLLLWRRTLTYKRDNAHLLQMRLFYLSGIVSDKIETKKVGFGTSEAMMSYFGPVHCPSKIGTHKKSSTFIRVSWRKDAIRVGRRDSFEFSQLNFLHGDSERERTLGQPNQWHRSTRLHFDFVRSHQRFSM